MMSRRDACLWAALALAACVGILGRGYWTPDEPREADLAWRMSWQADKAVPLLAGDAFCEKPPFAYWMAGAAIEAFGPAGWAARLPNLLYALVTALAIASLGRRSAGPTAGLVAAAAMGTFLLSYQVQIWLATDAPLLATVSVALLGLYGGFYAMSDGERLRGYCCMHAALGVGFLSKSAAAWVVPALTLAALIVWERRWCELTRWELYAGLGIQAVLILAWVGAVYREPDGPAHLKIFFWNNLIGRFARVDAPAELQYAAAHRNSPGKYLLELPVYLWPWTLLAIAAVRRAWRQRHRPAGEVRAVRFAAATFLPTLVLLSLAATARNIYLAPALPGVALLLGWWAGDLDTAGDRWSAAAIRATSLLLLLGVIACAVAVVLIGQDSWAVMTEHALYVTVSTVGLACAAAFAISAWRSARRGLLLRSLCALLFAYCTLLVGPASQIYRRVDAWQDLSTVGRDIGRDAVDRPLILFSPDETTRAFIDMYARTSVLLITGPITPAADDQLRMALDSHPRSAVVTQLPGRRTSPALRALAARLGLADRLAAEPSAEDAPPGWASHAHLRIAHRYALPNGRRYALLELADAATAR